MNPWLVFFVGLILGQFSMLFIIACCKAAGEADEINKAIINQEKALEADSLYGRACKYLLTSGER